MAYSQNGQYPLQPPRQTFPPPATPPQQPIQRAAQAIPQVVIPAYTPHLAQNQLLQPPLRPQTFPATAPPLSQQLPSAYSPGLHSGIHYGAISPLPDSSQTIANRPTDIYNSSQPLYPVSLPPRSRTHPPQHTNQLPLAPRQTPQPIAPQVPPHQIPTQFQTQTYSQPIIFSSPSKAPGTPHTPDIPKPSKIHSLPSPHAIREDSSSHQKHEGHANAKTPIDYQVLLLALADEYLDAARSQAPLLAVSRDQHGLNQYHKLIATGLRCMEALLKNWRLAPHTEALVILRFAKILYEETNNDTEVETILSKGIDVCERNRMFDLKYGMQQILCRMLAKSSVKAAMKTVDGVIGDIEAYQHVGWEYVFRLLRVSLSLTPSSHQDLTGALHNLQKTSSLANTHGDKGITVITAILEALIHLRESTNTDSIEHAQRAIAIARSRQMDPEVSCIPQLYSLIQMLDICCSIIDYDTSQSTQKLKAMQRSLDQDLHNPKWKDDGSFTLPMSTGTMESATPRERQKPGHTFELTMSWLSQHDLYALCYFLSSVTLSAKNSQDGHKAEKYLQEGLRMMEASLTTPQIFPELFTACSLRIQWRRNLYCSMLLHQVFLLCSRTEWRLASKFLKEARNTLTKLGDNASASILFLVEYARGVLFQATGDLAAAKGIFRQPFFEISKFSNKVSRSNPRRDISILANLNLVLLLRDPLNGDHSLASEMLDTLKPHCQSSPSKYLRAAHSLISATIHTESTIQTKRDLHQALQAATAIQNSQITCIALTFMSWKYFRGVVGEQSEKSAMAARAMAKKADDKLWISVTEDLLAETLDRQGKSGEAQALRDKADTTLEMLPPALKVTREKGVGNGSGKVNGEIKIKAVQV